MSAWEVETADKGRDAGRGGAQGGGAARFTPAQRRGAWVQACRLRTLPLAAAGSLVAAAIATSQGEFRWEVLLLMLVTSIALQVIANFADDYGDLKSGLDDDSRVGPRRGMQLGIITERAMRRALVGLCAATFVVGVALVAVSLSRGPAFTGSSVAAAVVFVALGVACIAAAILYTMGKHPYGYVGLGDLMSFVFFGLVAVVGGSFLYLHRFAPVSLVAGVALGLPVAAVMNVNNMRDARADAAKGKRTVANMLGDPAMRVYETALLAASAALFVASAAMCGMHAPWGYALLVASFVPWGRVLWAMWRTPDPERFDRLMKPTSMGSVLVAVVFLLVVALG
ncbi:MAG: 1,4-dihydroxy-2-naphthoate octaprenyltransferase [Coriobacteriales bacterium]|jgi:1,4-dihydroxy-2-naphthoate octaprenyltransferase